MSAVVAVLLAVAKLTVTVCVDGADRVTVKLKFFGPLLPSVKLILLIEMSGRCRQGQRQLKRCPGKHFHQEVVAPAAATTLHGDAVLARMLLEQG